ncbi:LmeA family phospholipid-binding protein [Streptomyces sp. NPDC089919]|uniref:LmeA family phospholipid-binding protein n=1 Tax=Streptomyces sp. NPDC089919 TaxID=3155188 RepID=UPI003418830E
MSRRPVRGRWRGRRKVLAVVTAVVVALAGLGAGAAELAARGVLRDRIAGAAPALGPDLSVATSGGWALWDLARGRIGRLDVSSGDARLGPLPGVSVRARLDDVRLGGHPTVGGSRAEVTAPPESVAAALRARAPALSVGEVTADPERGTLVAAVGPGGAGRLTLRPVLADGRVGLTVAGLTVFGREVPDPGRFGLDGAAAGPGPAARDYPLGLRASSVRVAADGVHVALSGGPGPLAGPR